MQEVTAFSEVKLVEVPELQTYQDKNSIDYSADLN